MSYQQQGGGFNNRLADYVQVNERIIKFYDKYPDGSIQTEILKWEDGTIVMKAYAYRCAQDERPATGHAYEKEGSSQVNRTSALENCETSAVGRALALLGFEIKKSVASKEEVANAIHQQEGEPEKPQFKKLELATPAQIKVLSAKCKEAGFDKDASFAYMDDMLGHHDTSKMTPEHVSLLIQKLPEYKETLH